MAYRATNGHNQRLGTNIKLVVDTDGTIYLDAIKVDGALLSFMPLKYDTQITYKENVKIFCKRLIDIGSLDSLYTVEMYDNEKSPSYSLTFRQDGAFGCRSCSDRTYSGSYVFSVPMVWDNDSTTKEPDSLIIATTDRQTWVERGIDYSKTPIIKAIDFASIGLDAIISEIAADADDYAGIYADFENKLFKINGLSLETGLVTTITDNLLKSIIGNERTLTEANASITNMYRDHHLMNMKHILMEFCFDLPSSLQGSGFSDIVGCLASFSPVSLSTFNAYTGFRLIESDTTLTPIGFGTSITNSNYTSSSFSTSCNGIGYTYPSIMDITINNIPMGGDRITLRDDASMKTLIYTITDISTDVVSQLAVLVDRLNIFYTKAYANGSFPYPLRVEAIGYDTLRIRAELDSPTFNNISIIAYPPAFTPKKKRVRSGSGYLDSYNFYKIDNKTFVYTNTRNLQNTLATNILDSVMYGSEVYTVDSYYVYNDLLCIHTNKYLNKKEYINTTLSFSKAYSFITAQPLDMVCVEYDRTKTYHNDCYDFSLSEYQKYLLETISSPTFYGKYDSSTPSETIRAYKESLTAYINGFFGGIQLDTATLLKDIEYVTKQGVSIVNEYDRLSENAYAELALGSVNSFIPRYAHTDGTDAFGNPYLLNAALPFGFSNFASLYVIDRDIRTHSHSLYTIAEGTPPWITGKRKIGYTDIPLVPSMLSDTSVDASLHIPYTTRFSRSFGVTKTFYKGQYFTAEDRYEGYRLSILLFTSQKEYGNSPSFQYTINDTFKVVYIYVTFYIPEPILTGLEQANVYYLDRSLLYFSNGNAATSSEKLSIGNQRVSFNLFDGESLKYFFGSSIGSGWLHTSGSDRFIYISRGTLNNTFGSDYRYLVSAGSDMVCYVGSSNEVDYLTFGAEITFVGLTDINKDSFWCRDITIKYKRVVGWETPDMGDDTVTTITKSFISDYIQYGDALFSTDNVYATLAPICLYNVSMEIQLSNTLNNDRFAMVSNGAVMGAMKDMGFPLLSGSTFGTDIVLTTDGNGKITKTNSPYMMPMYRHSGFYEALQYSQPFTESLIPQYIRNVYTSSLTLPQHIDRSSDLSSIYSVAGWQAEPVEFMGMVSRIWNLGTITLDVDASTGSANIYMSSLKSYLSYILRNNITGISDVTASNTPFLKENNFVYKDVYDYLCLPLYRYLMEYIYTIKDVKNGSGESIQYSFDGTILSVQTSGIVSVVLGRD